MAITEQPKHPNQSFRDIERLFRRVHRDNMKPDGTGSFLAFELPDMSVNREEYSTAEQARRGFRPEDGVWSPSKRKIYRRENRCHISTTVITSEPGTCLRLAILLIPRSGCGKRMARRSFSSPRDRRRISWPPIRTGNRHAREPSG